MKNQFRSVIIIGATSGIGRAVVEKLVSEGVRVGIAGRREERLKELQQRFGADRVSYRVMDVTEASATVALDELIAEVGAPDALLYASGIGKQNPTLDEDMELRTIATNCTGMVRIVDHFINYVKRTPAYNKRHRAHIAVITSVAGTMGMGPAPAYSATKSMQSAYLVALAQHARMQRIPGRLLAHDSPMYLGTYDNGTKLKIAPLGAIFIISYLFHGFDLIALCLKEF